MKETNRYEFTNNLKASKLPPKKIKVNQQSETAVYGKEVNHTRLENDVRRPKAQFFEGNQLSHIGILLIHGFTGSTNEMIPLAEDLHQQGYTVSVPLLRGHGTSPEDMQRTNWVDWFASAKKGYRQLKEAGCTQVVVIGLSMGGLLALKIGQHHPVQGMITLCAPMQVRDRRMGMAAYLQPIMPYTKRVRRKAKHIEQKIYIYDRTPLSCVVSLDQLMKNVKRLLPSLKEPILIVQACQDETVHPDSGEYLLQHIGSKEKELILFEHSTHVITLDHEQGLLHEKIAAFIQNVIRQREEPCI